MSKKKNYAELSSEALKNELTSLLKERFNIHMQKVSGQAVKTHLLREIRKNVARIKMLLAMKGVKV